MKWGSEIEVGLVNDFYKQFIDALKRKTELLRQQQKEKAMAFDPNTKTELVFDWVYDQYPVTFKQVIKLMYVNNIGVVTGLEVPHEAVDSIVESKDTVTVVFKKGASVSVMPKPAPKIEPGAELRNKYEAAFRNYKSAITNKDEEGELYFGGRCTQLLRQAMSQGIDVSMWPRIDASSFGK